MVPFRFTLLCNPASTEVGIVPAVDFASAPNFTAAAAAAQNLTWAPVSLSSVTVDSYPLAMATSDSALLTLSLTAELGVSGDIADVADVTGSRKRRLLQSSASVSKQACYACCCALGSLPCLLLHTTLSCETSLPCCMLNGTMQSVTALLQVWQWTPQWLAPV